MFEYSFWIIRNFINVLYKLEVWLFRFLKGVLYFSFFFIILSWRFLCFYLFMNVDKWVSSFLLVFLFENWFICSWNFFNFLIDKVDNIWSSFVLCIRLRSLWLWIWKIMKFFGNWVMVSGKVLFRWFKVKIWGVELKNLLMNFNGSVKI